MPNQRRQFAIARDQSTTAGLPAWLAAQPFALQIARSHIFSTWWSYSACFAIDLLCVALWAPSLSEDERVSPSSKMDIPAPAKIIGTVHQKPMMIAIPSTESNGKGGLRLPPPLVVLSPASLFPAAEDGNDPGEPGIIEDKA
mmetsp:Transcript_65070/g.121243  ORF Transcript_65070/g.121243 Transcript_65070/m.121243 type:complete len:142 (+) Transcript_65070:37-462(+)